LSPLYTRQVGLANSLPGQGPPRNTAAALKILGVGGVVGIGFSPDLDMSFQHCAGNIAQAPHPAFAGARRRPGRKPGLPFDGEVFLLQPAVGFLGMRPPGPAQQLVLDRAAHDPKGPGRTDVAMIAGPAPQDRVELANSIKTGFDAAFEHPDRRVAFGQGAKALANSAGAGAAFPEA
jgi:hypothetical protein